MEIDHLLENLDQTAAQLMGGMALAWRHPEQSPADPFKARIRKDWPTWKGAESTVLRKNEKNWFYAEFEWPAQAHGVSLDGTEGHLFMSGWIPFTLWIDGVEWAREEHAWLATGPLFEPITLKIEPGRKVQLILCAVPTELPTGFNLLNAGVSFRATSELAIHVEAAAAQLRVARAVARGAADLRLIERAAAELDLKAISAQRWPRLLASIERMEQRLAPLSPRAKAVTVHLIGHAHIDMDWMWTWEDTEQCIRRDIKAVSDMQDDYPELTFTNSQVPSYDVVRKQDPAVFKKVRQRIAEGRWEVAAGTWVEGDLNMADGEAIARHILYASDWNTQHLDAKARILWEPDTFGHPGNMPQLARLGELDAYFHFRANPGGVKTWAMRQWTGIDGTTLPVFSWFYGSDLAPRHAIEVALWSYAQGVNQAFHVWGMGDHGGGLSRWQLHLLSLHRDKPLMPTFKFGTMAQVLDALTPQELAGLPQHAGDTFPILEGCYTTHAKMKRYNRRCEGALLAAETLSAFAGLDRRDRLRDAWTPVLFNQFHDIFCGASVADAYINAYARAEASLKVARTVRDESLRRLVALDPKGNTLTVFNPLGFEITEPLRATLPAGTLALQDAEGNVIPVQRLGRESVFIARAVPAGQAKHYRMLTRLPRSVEFGQVAVTEETRYFRHELTIFSDFPEEAWFRVETPLAVAWVNKASGAIGSYFDKRLDREIVGYGVPKYMTHMQTMRQDLALNVFQLSDESPHNMTAWMIHDVVHQENLLRGASVTLMEQGPVFARLQVKHSFRSSTIEEDILFYHDFPRVDFKADIDWHEIGGPQQGVPQLKVSFGAGLSAARLRCEGPFCMAQWPADGLERPTQKWADLTGDEFGFTLLNDSKYGCDALGGRLRLTLLRNGYGPDSNSDEDRHTIHFAFEPHAAQFDAPAAVRAGIAYNRPPLIARSRTRVASAAPRLQLVGADSVVCTALRQAEHSDAILIRLFEAGGQAVKLKLRLEPGVKSAQVVNFLENAQSKPLRVENGWALLELHGFEVQTLKVYCKD